MLNFLSGSRKKHDIKIFGRNVPETRLKRLFAGVKIPEDCVWLFWRFAMVKRVGWIIILKIKTWKTTLPSPCEKLSTPDEQHHSLFKRSSCPSFQRRTMIFGLHFELILTPWVRENCRLFLVYNFDIHNILYNSMDKVWGQSKGLVGCFCTKK